MKVALVSCCTISYMPYIELYKNILQNLGIEYIIINEHEIEKSLQDNHYTYDVTTQKSLFGKIQKFFGWRSFVEKCLKEHEIDCVVLFTTWPGVKMIDFWVRKFKNKYILDIRDFSHESNRIYSQCVNTLIKNSYMTVVSSEKFKTWLIESEKISVVHNMPVKYEEEKNASLGKNTMFTIGYVGLVNYERQNKALVDAFSDCENILLKYKGTIEKKCHIKEYCEEKGIKNVEFTGKYDNKEKKKLYDDIDIINAVYGNDSLVVTTALPNKLYDCVIYKKPLLASKGTFLGELVEKYNIGISIDAEKDDIYVIIDQYIKSFDEEKFLAGCRTLMKYAKTEHKETIEKIEKLFLTQSN